MKNTFTDSINKIDLNPEAFSEDNVRILWISAANSALRESLTYKDHSHTFFEIHVILEGSLTYTVGDKELKLTDGKMLILPPRCVHRVKETSESFLKFTIAAECSAEGVTGRSLMLSGIRAYQIPDALYDNLDYITKLRKSYGNYAERIAEARMKETVFIIADALGILKEKDKDEYDGRIFKAIKYIEDNPSSFFTCDEIAAYCRICSRQLTRLFEKYEGKSPLEYIHEKKIELAKKMLTSTDDTQESICRDLGFTSVHYFNKFFLKKVGVTPGEYRKKMGL